MYLRKVSMLKPDTFRKYIFNVLDQTNMLYKPEYKVHKCLLSNSIDICFKVKNNLKPVICGYQLPTRSARSHRK